jgi:hypothetical protein
MFFRILEILFALAATYFVITQLVLPAYRGTKLFPWFRGEQDFYDSLLDLTQEEYEHELAQRVAGMRDALAAKQKSQPTKDTPA